MTRPKGSRNRQYQSKGALRVEKEQKTETVKTIGNHNPDPNTVVSPEQQAVIRRVQAESAEWEPITEESMHDFSLAIHPLSLKDNFPEAWKEQIEKRFAFRWCERTDKRIDELTRSGHPVTRWKLCTRTTTPFLSKYVDAVWGCVTRLDQVLLYRPWDRHMIEKNAKAGIAQARDEAGRAENIALRRAGDGVEAYSGPQHKIGANDVIQYEDNRDDSDGIGDLIVE